MISFRSRDLSLFASSAISERALMQDTAPAFTCSRACVRMHMYVHTCACTCMCMHGIRAPLMHTHLRAEGLSCCDRGCACLHVPILRARCMCMHVRVCVQVRARVHARLVQRRTNVCCTPVSSATTAPLIFSESLRQHFFHLCSGTSSRQHHF